MTPLLEHPAVWQEYEDAIRYYAAIDPDLAVDFDTAVSDEESAARLPEWLSECRLPAPLLSPGTMVIADFTRAGRNPSTTWIWN